VIFNRRFWQLDDHEWSLPNDVGKLLMQQRLDRTFEWEDVDFVCFLLVKNPYEYL